MIKARRPERREARCVEIGSYDEEFALQLAKIVCQAWRGRKPLKIATDRAAVENAVRQRLRKPLEGRHGALLWAAPQIVGERGGEEPRECGDPLAIFAKRQFEKNFGLERFVVFRRLDEPRVHLARGKPIGETRSEEGARTDADEHVAVVQAKPAQGFI